MWGTEDVVTLDPYSTKVIIFMVIYRVIGVFYGYV